VITVVQPVDYESSHEFFLTIQATDRGTPPLSNTAVLKLNVTDANDNAPMFAQERYMVELKEDAAHGAKVIKVRGKSDSRMCRGRVFFLANLVFTTLRFCYTLVFFIATC
jgi:hypothetical protein